MARIAAQDQGVREVPRYQLPANSDAEGDDGDEDDDEGEGGGYADDDHPVCGCRDLSADDAEF